MLVSLLPMLYLRDGLRCLDLRDNPIDDGEGGQKLAEAVEQSERLVALNGIDINGVRANLACSQADGWQPFTLHLCRRLQKCSTLRYLNLDSNDFRTYSSGSAGDGSGFCRTYQGGITQR